MFSKVFSRLSILLLIPSSLGAVIDIDAPAATNVIDLGYATYQGSFNQNTTNTQFLGIRFAAPPTGTLRWREPQQPATIAGVQLANEFPNRCLAGDRGNSPKSPFRMTNSTIQSRDLEKRAVPPFSEDCLFLNVWVPGTLNQAKNLPVVVFIHGGGYARGSASGLSGNDTFDGNDLIREAGGGVVAVTIQYRLGVFGFLAGQKLA
ncbi:Carboxylesterase [Crucibulum laeve]|uniref:Carboxylesterase n=1 Tax=Crucibulum laeve TaxID=68775 RepID=A0A5C3LRP9_9AGAR|nr:Carboxylesterase [Crucibulum laeve]